MSYCAEGISVLYHTRKMKGVNDRFSGKLQITDNIKVQPVSN